VVLALVVLALVDVALHLNVFSKKYICKCMKIYMRIIILTGLVVGDFSADSLLSDLSTLGTSSSVNISFFRRDY